MSIAIIKSRASQGIYAPLVTIEVHLSKGLPGFNIVGLPETAVKESRDRVRSAIINSDFDFPVSRLVVNLAPADLPKEGGRFDLPIALGILAASGQIPYQELDNYEFASELALTGELRGVKAILPFAVTTQNENKKLMISFENANEASLVENLEIFSAHNLKSVCDHFRHLHRLTVFSKKTVFNRDVKYSDLKDVIGQLHGKRALEIAAAGNHSLLMVGPPGTGKTMLASRLPSILPPMDADEALESAMIYSISRHGFHADQWRKRPFRSPHHTASSIALVGGGRPPAPGEISLAHGGVLFLDELPEFNRSVLEVLREPLESGVVSISRASYQTQFPARCQLIVAMNPCPCGYLGDTAGRCHCTSEQVQKYQMRLSGPLLDRIDMRIEIPPLPKMALLKLEGLKSESSAEIQNRVIKVRDVQLERVGKPNAFLNNEEIKKYCALTEENQNFLEDAMQQFGLSTRAYHRILKCARTIADLAEQPQIEAHHLQEALSYRKLAQHGQPAVVPNRSTVGSNF